MRRGSSDELELHVVVWWGASVLETVRISPPRSTEVGVDPSLGPGHRPVLPVEVDRAGRVWIEGARLDVGETRRIERQGLVFEAWLDVRQEAVVAKPPLDRAAWSGQGVSVLLHAAVLLALLAFVPLVDSDGEEDLQLSRDAVARLITADRQRDFEQSLDAEVGPSDSNVPPSDAAAPKSHAPIPGGSGETHGFLDAARSGLGARGPRAATDDAIDPAHFGVIFIITEATTNNPSSGLWGAPPSGGNDLFAIGNGGGRGNGGDTLEPGGLGLSGIGEGGGSHSAGIGLANIGGLGSLGVTGTCDDDCLASGAGFGRGFGRSLGHLARGHHTRGAISLCGDPPGAASGSGCLTTVSGRLPPEIVQRIVRQNFGRFRLCYQQGMEAKGNSLSGRVAVKFVIGRDGSVASASNGGSDLPDAQVVSCVVRAFAGLSFPAPEGGVVSVTYPIFFSPSD